jgi:hypothetical protein
MKACAHHLLPKKSSAAAAAEAKAESGLDTPLDYMLRVMRDPKVDPARRDEMAKLALPYLHAKPAAAAYTGKEGGPTEISGLSPADIARRVGFILMQGGQSDPAQP